MKRLLQITVDPEIKIFEPMPNRQSFLRKVIDVKYCLANSDEHFQVLTPPTTMPTKQPLTTNYNHKTTILLLNGSKIVKFYDILGK